MRTIVTGGAGFIGSHIADRLLALGHDVTVVDDLSQGRRENVPVAASFVLRDIASPDTADLVADLKPELVVHAAAQASVPRSIADPQHDARTNIIGTLTLLNGVSRSGCRCFIYVTTGGALYGDPVQLPCSESHPVRPLSPYGLSKWTAERYLDLLADACAVRTALRLANVYGPRQRSDGEGGVVSVFLDRMRSQGTVEIHGDGEQTRDFVYVGDVVDAVVAASIRSSLVDPQHRYWGCDLGQRSLRATREDHRVPRQGCHCAGPARRRAAQPPGRLGRGAGTRLAPRNRP